LPSSQSASASASALVAYGAGSCAPVSAFAAAGSASAAVACASAPASLASALAKPCIKAGWCPSAQKSPAAGQSRCWLLAVCYVPNDIAARLLLLLRAALPPRSAPLRCLHSNALRGLRTDHARMAAGTECAPAAAAQARPQPSSARASVRLP
jgi:hypothetical protein